MITRMIKTKAEEQADMAREAQSLKLIIVNAIPAGADYAAILLALAEVQKEIVRLWIDQSPPTYQD